MKFATKPIRHYPTHLRELFFETQCRLRVNYSPFVKCCVFACCPGSWQNAADHLADGLHEALSSDAGSASRHCTQVDVSKLDGGDQTLGAINACCLPHWRPSPAGNLHRRLSLNNQSISQLEL